MLEGETIGWWVQHYPVSEVPPAFKSPAGTGAASTPLVAGARLPAHATCSHRLLSHGRWTMCGG